MPVAHLPARALVSVSGLDAEHFLQNLITTDLAALDRAMLKPGALLTPQGKILFDFLISRSDGGFRLDCRADIAEDLVKRLTIYKLRSKVVIETSNQDVVAVAWDDEAAPLQTDSSARDLRFDVPVWRIYESPPPASAELAAWTAFRVAAGIAESGRDFELSDVFPHDVLYDLNGGVGLKKGCYVGQEVVSRMQHRGTARRRVMVAHGNAVLPGPGTGISVNGRAIGTLGSSAGEVGIAIVRIDRVKDAIDAGDDILAADVKLSLSIPAWAGYTLPGSGTAD